MSIILSARNSYDLDGAITQYNWNFGDGTRGNGMITTHTYSSNGIFEVTLTVVDNDGFSDFDTVLG